MIVLSMIKLDKAMQASVGPGKDKSSGCSLFIYRASRRIMPGKKINNELLIINLAAVMGGNRVETN